MRVIQSITTAIGLTLRDLAKLFLGQVSWHSLFLSDLARQMKPKRYLEVGIYQGETFKLVSRYAEESVGVDIAESAVSSISSVPKSRGFLGTLEAFLKENQSLEKFDLIFIDADHSMESVMEDFGNAYHHLSPNGLLVLHDTWPGSVEFASSGFCGNAYLAVGVLREKYRDWSFVTLPTHPGMTFCQRNSAKPSWVM
jgi:predicted O-methyltransferase YrrM